MASVEGYRVWTGASLVVALLTFTAATAKSQEPPSAPTPPSTTTPAQTPAPVDDTSPSAGGESVCPPGNLLAGLRPTQTQGVQRAFRANDGTATVEGAFWNSAYTAVLQGDAATLEYDLGKPVHVAAMVLQGDNNDTYQVEFSLDGQSWESAWEVPIAHDPGMRKRVRRTIDRTARYIRIGKAQGDTYYSIGEVQAFCQVPAVFPPDWPVEKSTQPDNSLKLTRDHKLNINKVVIGIFAFIMLLGLFWSKEREEKMEEALWTCAAIAGGVGVVGVVIPLVSTLDVPFLNGISLMVFAAVLLGAMRWGREREGFLPTLALVGGTTAMTAYVAMLTLGIANGIAATVIVFGGCYVWAVKRKGAKGEWRARSERAVLVVTVFCSLLSWINFGTFHGVRQVHLWDTFHYYIGSKYFAENRYHLLYQCAAVAEVDDGRKEEVLQRKYRVLRNNALGPAERALEDEPACREAFTPARWAAFQQDLRLFRELMSPGWFKDLWKDHGYNASPVWNMVGALISNYDWEAQVPPPELVNSPNNLAGKTEAQKKAIQERFAKDRNRLDTVVKAIALIDAVLYVGIFILIGWAFGLKAAAFSCIVWAVGHPWAYYWTGGGFGRAPWLFTAVAGLCLIKKGHNLLGAFSITWSALLRIFPAALPGGVVLKMLINAFKERRLTRGHLAMIVGGTLALVILIPASLPSAGGLSAYSEFLTNSEKHKATPLTNHMGLPTLVSYDPSHVARKTHNPRLDDPFAEWKRHRQENLKNRWLLYWGLVAGLFAAVGYVSRKEPDWVAVSLSSAFIFALFELTCYYYNFVVLLGPLAVLRRRHALSLMGMSVLTGVASLGVGWFDELYVVDSFLFFAVVVYFLVDLGLERRRAELGATETSVTQANEGEPSRAATA